MSEGCLDTHAATRPYFTIGIPVYNAEKYLPLCVNSILDQSFGDFELILVNDGSKDNSLNICLDYQVKDDRVIVIDQENGGVSAASNRILDVARGKYIYLMDNDDEMYAGILQKVYDYLQENEVDILHGGYYSSLPNKELKLRLFRNPDIKNGFATNAEFIEYQIKHGFAATMWTKFVKNEFWKKTQVRFISRYDGCQDADVSCRLMQKAKTVHYTDDIIMTWFHPREGSISTEWSYSMIRNSWRRRSDTILEVVTMPDVPQDLKYEFVKKSIFPASNSLWRIPIYSDEQLGELDEIISPVRKWFKSAFANNRRDKFLLLSIKLFGVYRTSRIISVGRRLKSVVKK